MSAPSTAGGSLTENIGQVLQNGNNNNSPALDLGPPTAQQQQQQQQGSSGASTAASTDDDVAHSPPRRVFRRESRYTPPGSPGGLDKEQSVKELYQSARDSFDGALQPKAGLVALEHPVRQGPSRMVMEQDWTVTAGTAAAPAPAPAEEEEEEEEEEEPWRPPSPQPSPPRVRDIVHKLPACLQEEVEEEEEEEEEEEDMQVASQPVARACVGTASEVRVVTSAPGKVILFGEHAVVYGKTAVGAAVSDLRVVVTASTTVEPELVLELPDLDVSFRRTTLELSDAFGFSLAVAPGAKPTPPAPAHLDLISAFLGDEGRSKDGKKALVSLVFLTHAIVPEIFLGKAGAGARGLSLRAFSASLPVGAGLGSSAALCVATSAALTRLADIIARSKASNGDVGGGAPCSRGVDHPAPAPAVGDPATGAAVEGGGERGGGGSRRPSGAELERINAWAFAGETVLHGTPSGLDNTVSCYGGAIKFVKGMDGAANTTEPIPGFPPLTILLTNTLVPKNTGALVAGVRRLLEAHRPATAATFDAIGAIAAEFLDRAAASVPAATPVAAAECGDGASANAAPAAGAGAGAGQPLTAECVGELAEMNHRLLCALGVGHPALERVCEVASAHGCRSKLTGAGGGGCAVTILSGEDLCKASLVEAMLGEGFKCYETSIGGDGVLFHGDAVPPPFVAAAAAAAAKAPAVARGGDELEMEKGWSMFLGGVLAGDREETGLGVAAAAAAVVIAAAVPVVLGWRGLRYY